MTIHKLTRLGGRQTSCNLTVPPIIKLNAADATWDDGDGHVEGRCLEGCWPKPAVNMSPGFVEAANRFATTRAISSAEAPPFDPAKVTAPAPSAPRPPGAVVRRFNALANLPHSGPTVVGNAIVNRDGTINVHLTLMPGDGKLRLVPA
jgi:hypothetical protein